MLADLAIRLRQSIGMEQKQDIQTIARKLAKLNLAPAASSILLGDDCAAIPDRDGYLLFAAEGMWPTLVANDPWFAGWCSVLVNVSDIYAMGGRPIAVVDALWTESTVQAELLWQGMITASQRFNVPIVGGHTNCHSDYQALSVSILGRANQLITSFNAQTGDTLLLLTDFNGQPYGLYPCWDAATQVKSAILREKLELLPQLAEMQLCDAGKDVSMGGIIGTALMLLETSGCGAMIDLDAIPVPPVLSLEQWLLSFPSYGFLLSVRPSQVERIQQLAQPLDLVCAPIGQVTADSQLSLKQGDDSLCFWDIAQDALTGFAGV
ncbi:sll0787 family AIR synthase-like protein [filamentous cyanobacterium LEGE 11480]|uniref:Sll0787 family AIR synthase-like protein n=1 Tax=Romeriopsis navalis LEGE 11480 TaxID=2777977 RepID=A0A928VIA0_9CYAN|nr:sll0787 family AIR synthase-like protein [Romeriopsis navalis]MBE9028830.1 sll0787 family AIR synthase-like protein [Romeriopsis navalis LEGE 11480]